jgi:hypothetical protein
LIKQMCKYVILFIITFTSLMQTNSFISPVMNTQTMHVYDDHAIPNASVDEFKYINRSKTNRQTIVNLFILKFSLLFKIQLIFTLLILGLIQNRNFFMDFRKKIRRMGIMHFHGSKYKDTLILV